MVVGGSIDVRSGGGMNGVSLQILHLSLSTSYYL